MRRGVAYQLAGPDAPGRAAISYVRQDGVRRTLRPSPDLLHEPIVHAQPSRRPAARPMRRNTEGFYWFEQTARHVWHESMTEYTALMLLDHNEEISGICTQPMRVDFGDGSAHFPDLFVVHADGRQEVCNVRPADLIDEDAAAQFQKMADVCALVGWTHRVIVDIPLIERHNLEWIAAYRHPRNEPSDELAGLLLDAVHSDRRFGDLWRLTRRSGDPHALAGLYNLLWHREIAFDTSLPLDMNTPIWRL